MKKLKIKLIYGIGNEGKGWEKTKHNLGKKIIKNYFQKPKSLKDSVYDNYGSLILATNLGYINNCGRGLKELMKKFKLKPENILVLHDDADLIFPLFKTTFGSSPAGHKGIISIIKNLKTKNFWRFRLGIQNKKRKKAEEIVLQKWSAIERKKIEDLKRKFKFIFELLKERLPNELNIPKNYFQ